MDDWGNILVAMLPPVKEGEAQLLNWPVSSQPRTSPLSPV